MSAARPQLRVAPLTKTARQSRIADLVEASPVASQGQLAALLAADGVRVTQATLSRDLEELGAVKDDGVYRLTRAPRATRRVEPDGHRLARLCQELLISAEAAGQLVVARTPPGGAHLLASALDRSAAAELAGTVAGDDTVLLICRTAAAAGALADQLLALADGRPQ